MIKKSKGRVFGKFKLYETSSKVSFQSNNTFWSNYFLNKKIVFFPFQKLGEEKSHSNYKKYRVQNGFFFVFRTGNALWILTTPMKPESLRECFFFSVFVRFSEENRSPVLSI